MKHGYARVSKDGQSVDAQVRQPELLPQVMAPVEPMPLNVAYNEAQRRKAASESIERAQQLRSQETGVAR
jgi:hypothetical protein